MTCVCVGEDRTQIYDEKKECKDDSKISSGKERIATQRCARSCSAAATPHSPENAVLRFFETEKEIGRVHEA